jgi:hypothetical protein
MVDLLCSTSRKKAGTRWVPALNKRTSFICRAAALSRHDGGYDYGSKGLSRVRALSWARTRHGGLRGGEQGVRVESLQMDDIRVSDAVVAFFARGSGTNAGMGADRGDAVIKPSGDGGRAATSRCC